MGILVQPSDRTDIGNRDIRIAGNLIRDKHLNVNVAALRIYGVDHATVMANDLQNITHQYDGRGILIGSHCNGTQTDNVLVAGNSVVMSNAPQSGYSIWATNSSLFLNNQENGSSLTSVTDYCNIDPFIFP